MNVIEKVRALGSAFVDEFAYENSIAAKVGAHIRRDENRPGIVVIESLDGKGLPASVAEHRLGEVVGEWERDLAGPAPALPPGYVEVTVRGPNTGPNQ